MGGELVREVFKGLDRGVQAEVLKQVMGWEDCLKALSYCAWPPLGFPGATSDQELACQCRRYKRLGFDPWVRKIPWRRAWQPTPVFLPGESHGQRSRWVGHMTKAT